MTEREHADVSRRNPDTLEKRETSRWLDIGSAIVLALATMASAWCGYQSALFATVLFFGGISGTFRSRRLQLTAFAIAVLLFVVTVVGLGSMPICNE